MIRLTDRGYYAVLAASTAGALALAAQVVPTVAPTVRIFATWAGVAAVLIAVGFAVLAVFCAVILAGREDQS